MHFLIWQSTHLQPQGMDVSGSLLKCPSFELGVFENVVVQMPGDSPGSPLPWDGHLQVHYQWLILFKIYLVMVS